ncbi:MAG: 50S ribosomal protein L13 [Chloroflexia bacterium]
MSVKTYTPKGDEAAQQREWYIINAEGQTLGRLATLVAQVLRGKNKPVFTPHMDMGDYVIVINAAKVVVTGNKASGKNYYSHSGYLGHLKVTPFNEMIEKHPTFAVQAAVRGMLPRNRLGADMLNKLKVYEGDKHPHAAQQPKELRINPEHQRLEPVLEPAVEK